jgi:hypothetical protein
MSGDVAAFARAVRLALVDLPLEALEELLEDLDEHLAETLAESGDALGSPEAYAAELRQAAGLPEPTEVVEVSRFERLRAWWAAHRTVQEVSAFLPELRPGWWVLRGYLAAGLASAVADAGNGITDFTVPFGPWLCVPVVLAAVVLSVRIGRWSQRRVAGLRSMRHAALLALNLLVVGVFVAEVQHNGSPVYAETSAPSSYGSYLAGPDGSAITDIFPFTADGRPLTGVLLYDQDGRPIDNLVGARATSVLPGPPAPSNAFPRGSWAISADPLPLVSSSPGAVPTLPAPSASPTAPPAEPGPSPTVPPTG